MTISSGTSNLATSTPNPGCTVSPLTSTSMRSAGHLRTVSGAGERHRLLYLSDIYLLGDYNWKTLVDNVGIHLSTLD